MKKFLVPAMIFSVVLAIVLLTFSGGNRAAYIQEIEQVRADRAKFLKTSLSSPFVMNNQEFKPLSYFEINPSFKLTAGVERLTTRQYMNIANSDGTSTRYLKYAYLNFRLKGVDCKLLVLKRRGMGPLSQLFLAFGDETSGETTYGGGRYLDLDDLNGDQITLDFNRAYNPYCAYSSEYLCPLPPGRTFSMSQSRPARRSIEMFNFH